jgi:hypothetical protein
MGMNFDRASLVACVAVALCSTSMAGKPEWAGQGHGKHGAAHASTSDAPAGEARSAQPQSATVDIRIGGYFEDRQREEASRYYSAKQASGHCPPGLAKKNNGCMPPGQAKKWAMGKPLAKDVVFYPVPREISVKIGLPPAGYKYVRVANDILMVAIGSMMVVDAIEDLMR